MEKSNLAIVREATATFSGGITINLTGADIEEILKKRLKAVLEEMLSEYWCKKRMHDAITEKFLSSVMGNISPLISDVVSSVLNDPEEFRDVVSTEIKKIIRHEVKKKNFVQVLTKIVDPKTS